MREFDNYAELNEDGTFPPIPGQVVFNDVEYPLNFKIWDWVHDFDIEDLNGEVVGFTKDGGPKHDIICVNGYLETRKNDRETPQS